LAILDYGIGKKDDSRKDAKDAKYRQNYKFEIRSSKQIQMIKKQKIPNNLVLDFGFWI